MDKKKLVIIIGSVLVLVFVLLALILIFSSNKDNLESSYTISFEADGGTFVGSQVLRDGEKVKKPVDPVKEGYMFVEWLYNNVTYDFTLEVKSDLVLTAKWVKIEENVKTFLIKFESDDGTTIPNQIIKKGDKIVKPVDPVKDGYTFLGWMLDDKVYDFESVVEDDNIILIAKWEKLESDSTTSSVDSTSPVKKKYTVTFNSNGGSSISNKSVEDGKKVVKPSNPTRSGYTFVGWTLNGSMYNFDTKITKNIELVALWLKTPTIKYEEVGQDESNITYDVSIDYQSYRVDDKNILTGWELYVTSDNSLGDEMIIDGVGYFLHSNNGNETIRPADVDYGDTHRYRARVYIDTVNGRVYSGWSNIISMSASLKTPTIKYEKVGQNETDIIYDVSIDYQSYRVGDKNILTGWELYVTSDNSLGDEMIIDGVGYFLHSNNGNETIRPADVDYGDTHRYRARVYIDTVNGRVYSGWSNIISMSASLKAPTIKYEKVGEDGNNAIYDVSIDYQSYRVGDKNILTGWELYVTSDNSLGDEMIIDGVGYFLHSNNGNETIRPADVDYGDTHRYRARVYVDTINGRVYSGWSNIISITPKR